MKSKLRNEQEKFLELIKDYVIKESPKKKEKIDALYITLTDKLPIGSTERNAIDTLYKLTK